MQLCSARKWSDETRNNKSRETPYNMALKKCMAIWQGQYAFPMVNPHLWILLTQKHKIDWYQKWTIDYMSKISQCAETLIDSLLSGAPLRLSEMWRLTRIFFVFVMIFWFCQCTSIPNAGRIYTQSGSNNVDLCKDIPWGLVDMLYIIWCPNPPDFHNFEPKDEFTAKSKVLKYVWTEREEKISVNPNTKSASPIQLITYFRFDMPRKRPILLST